MKDAILIVAHKNDLCLQSTLKILDSKYFDIFIHMDSKSKNIDFDEIKSICKKSKVYFTPRLDVRWGGYSLTKAEILLLKTAYNTDEYRYFHMISGADLPLKSAKEIYDFFTNNNGYEFINFYSKEFNLNKRTDYYYFFQDKQTRNKKDIYEYLNKGLVKIQKILKFKRKHKYFNNFMKGCNWFSITNELTSYVISLEDKIEKDFKYSYCSDEMFLQTIVYNSKFKDKLINKDYNDDYSSIKRYIDWNRGKPYTFKIDDLDDLLNSGMLFARKFDENIDSKIIKEIYNKIVDYIY